jgi:hypothetical protein
MNRLERMRPVLGPLAMPLLAALLCAWPSPSARAAQDNPQNPPQGQQEQNQNANPQQKQEKKGGFFEGMKAVAGSSSSQTSYTASAGAKGVGEGKKIGDVTPTATDRQAVMSMERFFIPPMEVKKFDEDGHLKPEH